MYNNFYPYRNNNRFVGGFFGPFILGGITGGLLAPAFIDQITIIIFIHMDITDLITDKTIYNSFFLF